MPPAKVCELPDYILSSHFTGRSNELQWIDRALNEPSASGDRPPRCVIHGMPGVGKTQLALQFATHAYQKGQYPHVFCVSAASVERVTQGFCKLVYRLRLPGRHTSDQASKLIMAKAWLEAPTTAGTWLLVLDNVNQETAVMLRDILPRGECKGRLLMTTRTATTADMLTASNASSQLALQPPGTGDAIAMLLAGAHLQRGSMEDAQRLVQTVGRLPLAIDQAASYMQQTGNSPQEVLGVYKSNEVVEVIVKDFKYSVLAIG